MLVFDIQKQSRVLSEVLYGSLDNIGSPQDVKELLYWAHAIATRIYRESRKLEHNVDKLK
jgi:hypothetical protein